jgi:elongation factor G
LHTGTVARAGRVEDGTTASDFDEVEIRQKRSVNLAVTPFVSDGITVNLLDTPGYADFTGDLRAGLRAADCALFVVAATDGIDGVTRLLWDECAAVGMPRAVVITKIDHGRADYSTVLAECQGAFGEGVLPLYLPVSGAGGVSGLIGLLSETLYDYSSGTRSASAVTEASDDAQLARDALIEGIITESEDESLMERYLSGETVATDVLIDDLETAVARGSFYPVLAVSSPLGIGMAELLEIVTQAFPSPLEHPLPPVTSAVTGEAVTGLTGDPDGPLLAEVVKTTSDPYVGRISLVRVFSGTLRPDMSVHVSGHGRAERGHPDHDDDERVGALTSPLGKQQRPVTECPAGSICAVAKLSTAETGDTLSSREEPLLMEPWSMPDPLLPVAIVARSKADEDKLSAALQRLVAEDPTMRLEINAETHQLVLWCIGEAHADVLLDRLSARFGVTVDTVTLRVPLRETVSLSARGLGRNVKQTGGHGEYGICHIEVEPLPNGAGGFEFVDKIVGGVVPRQYIPSVEKGVRSQMEAGVLAGYPMTGVRVTLFDGKAHPVDSSDMAFQKAGRAALRDACDKAAPMLLEPVDEVSILVPDEYVGAIMSDLSGRRGRVVGTVPVGVGRTQIRAEVPELEITRYSIDLRSLTQGTGSFTRGYVRHEPLPSHLAAKVAADSRPA